MTDKQIIIDGVNIKDCKRRIGKDNYCRYYKRPCSENNFNCIWKKYLRKEQECEELKKELIKKDGVDTFFNTPIEGWSNDPCEICKYKQTLTEIKEIAEENIRIADLEGLNGVYRRGLAEQILQKISECEEKMYAFER